MHRQPLEASIHALIEPTVPRSRKVERGDEYRQSKPRDDAWKGAEKPRNETDGR